MISFYRRQWSIFYLGIFLLPWRNIFYLDIFLPPWCNIFFLNIILLPWWTFLTLISFYCRDGTFSTLMQFYCQDGTFYLDICLLPSWNIFYLDIFLSWCTGPFFSLEEHFYIVFIRPWSELVCLYSQEVTRLFTVTLYLLFRDNCLPLKPSTPNKPENLSRKDLTSFPIC